MELLHVAGREVNQTKFSRLFGSSHIALFVNPDQYIRLENFAASVN
jgi:hypothetical protein